MTTVRNKDNNNKKETALTNNVLAHAVMYKGIE